MLLIMKNAVVGFLVMLVLSMSLLTARVGAQSAAPTKEVNMPPAVSAPSVSLPTIKETDRDKLALLATRRALYEAQAKNLQEDFQKAVEKLAKDYGKATDEFNAKIDSVFLELNLDRATHDINLETGQVTEIPLGPKGSK